METYNCKFQSPPLLLYPWAQGGGGKLCVFPVTNNERAKTLKYGKTGNKRRTTCFATLLQNVLNGDVVRFTTHIKRLNLNGSGKTRNIAIQLVFQQCCKTSCTFFVARFSVP